MGTADDCLCRCDRFEHHATTDVTLTLLCKIVGLFNLSRTTCTIVLVRSAASVGYRMSSHAGATTECNASRLPELRQATVSLIENQT